MLERRRSALEKAWGLRDEVVLVGAGSPIPIPGTDQFFEFLAHAEFRYLADAEWPGAVLLFDPGAGWSLYAPPVSRADRFWLGSVAAPGEPLDSLPGRVAGRRVAMLGCPVVEGDAELTARVRAAVDGARLVKDGEEIARMRRAAAATAVGHEAARDALRPGMTERELRGIVEAGFFRGGAHRRAYASIVAGGAHAGVLHFEPGDRPLAEGEMVLIDAGAERDGYCADVTRTLPVSGTFSPEQKELHDLVGTVQRAAIDRCRVGAEWRELHLAACVDLARGLVDFGLLRGDPESLVARDAHALFMPHGLGHLLGLNVHDAGGYAPGRTPSDRFGLCFLRADLPLPAGCTITVEPGLYFIPALLHDPEFRDRHRDDVAWDRAEALLGLGGIRIEDNVHVTPDGPEVLTS